MEAKAKGTPEGEGAKVVRDLAFRRIRLREEQLEKSEGCQARLAAQCEQLMLEGEELMRKLHESEAGRAKLEEEAVKLRGSLAAKESEVLEAWSHNEVQPPLQFYPDTLSASVLQLS